MDAGRVFMEMWTKKNKDEKLHLTDRKVFLVVKMKVKTRFNSNA